MTTEIDKRTQLQYAERKGLEAGLERGRAEKLEAARKMKADGLAVEMICRYTGLSHEQLV